MIKYLKYLYIFKIKNKFLSFFWKTISFLYFRKEGKPVNELIVKNRKYLEIQGELIKKEEYLKNDYGILEKNFKYINEPIFNRLCNFDLIVFLINSIQKERINYLEIGASVLKTFMIVENNLKNSKLIAFDINPIISKHKDKFRHRDSKNNNLRFSGELKNQLYYFKGDLLDQKDTKDFKKLITDNFDFIFSDALHTQNGIETEYYSIIKNKLNNKFFIYYDDLDTKWDSFGVQRGVFNIFYDLKKEKTNVNLYTFWIHGWIGQHENLHKNGIITNIDLDDLFKKYKLNLPFLKKY